MKLKVFLSKGIPLTELSKRQQERFIKQLITEKNEFVRLGLERSLLIMGYEVVKEK